MKRSFFLVVCLFSLLLLALNPIKAFAIQAKAVVGEPFGVCRIELPLSPAEQETVASHDYKSASFFEMIHQASVYESNKRALYPTWGGNFCKSGTPGKKVLLFLFQGWDELDLLLSRTGFEAFQEELRIKPIKNEELHKELIEEWWGAYLSKLTLLHSLDFYDASVELGIASMMGRRLGLSLDSLKSRYFNKYNDDYNYMIGFFLGTESIRLAMQTETMLNTKEIGEEADKDLPEAALPPVMPVPHFDDSKAEVEPLAMRVPAECFYLRFASFPGFLEARNFLDSWGAILRTIISSRGTDFGMSQRIERQLALRETALSRYFGDGVINDVAVIGADTFLREGAAIGVLFQAKQNALLKSQLDSIRSDILKENTSVRESSVTINGHAVSLLSSPLNEVRSFYVQDGDFHLVTTSSWMAQRFLEIAKTSGESLGSLEEFRYARSQIESSESGIFIYLSDPFFRNLVGPAYRVEMTRRAQSISELQMLSLARLAAVQEGLASPSVASLIEKGFLPGGFGMRHDKSEPILDEDGAATDSIRGTIGSFVPIPDMTIDKVTSAEVEAYENFARAYSGLWTYMDPVFGLLNNEKTPTGEKLILKLNISPYVRRHYDFLYNFLGQPENNRIATVSGDLVSLQARLSPVITNYFFKSGNIPHIFCTLRDSDIPWSIIHGEIDSPNDWLNRYAKGYIGFTIPPNFDEKDLLGFKEFFGQATEPDADGYARLDDGGWSRRFDSYYITGTGRSLLETVTPNIRTEETDFPSQVYLNIGDLSESLLRKYLRAEAYVRDRRTSAGNALLLHAYQQQLQPNDLNGALMAVQNQSLTCPLGGSFVPADEEEPDRFKSTAWIEDTLYQTNQLTDTYRQAIIDETENLRLEFLFDWVTLKTRLEITTKRQ
ncbi:MAG: hypothetical protein FWH52_04120 [Synergistaceae bacterium]|nr:hypothetical protein [Synergistaceae bacterium]